VTGQASATAIATGGRITNLRADAIAPLPSGGSIRTNEVQARAAVGRTAAATPGPVSSAFQSVAYVTGNPLTADVSAAEAGNTRITRAFTASSVVGIGTMSGAYSTGASGLARGSTSTIACTLDLSTFSPASDLILGLENPQVTGTGFSSLEFTVREQNTAVLDKTFTTIPTATTYFADHPMDLGALASHGSPLPLTFTLAVTGTLANSGFLTNLIFGSIPTTPGDTNHDGSVNFSDLLTLAQHYGQASAVWETGDFNNDHSVNFTDLLTLAQHYGFTLGNASLAASGSGAPLAEVPEPGIAAGTFLAGGFLVRRRRTNAAQQ
jgi:hypothetical protein